MNGSNASGYRRLVSLTCVVTVQCVHHGSHTATVQGPYRWVMDLVGTFRDLCADQGRWCLTEWTPSSDLLEERVGDWD